MNLRRRLFALELRIDPAPADDDDDDAPIMVAQDFTKPLRYALGKRDGGMFETDTRRAVDRAERTAKQFRERDPERLADLNAVVVLGLSLIKHVERHPREARDAARDLAGLARWGGEDGQKIAAGLSRFLSPADFELLVN